MRRGMTWLLDKQIRKYGDWRETVDAPSGGWCFEYENDFYPDVDDTAMVAMALAGQFAPPSSALMPPELRVLPEPTEAKPPSIAKKRKPDSRERPTLLQCAEKWLLAMQNRDGGWVRSIATTTWNCSATCRSPITMRWIEPEHARPSLALVLESLGHAGPRRVGDPRVDRAVAYLRKTQEADGSWFGRWGVNYIYGTWQVLTGLKAIGLPLNDPMIAAAVNWLLCCQQPCGGWGESCDTYEDERLRGTGNPTASQTAWAVMGLNAAGFHDHEATARGVRFLVEQQQDDGSWAEADFTGTGFPRVLLSSIPLLPHLFPADGQPAGPKPWANNGTDWAPPRTAPHGSKCRPFCKNV